MKKRKPTSKKTKATVQERRGSMDHFKYEDKPGVIMKTGVDKESPADRELKRMVHGDVFRSAKHTVKQSNSNKRRYS